MSSNNEILIIIRCYILGVIVINLHYYLATSLVAIYLHGELCNGSVNQLKHTYVCYGIYFKCIYTDGIVYFLSKI
jgi:hypothetical protein